MQDDALAGSNCQFAPTGGADGLTIIRANTGIAVRSSNLGMLADP